MIFIDSGVQVPFIFEIRYAGTDLLFIHVGKTPTNIVPVCTIVTVAAKFSEYLNDLAMEGEGIEIASQRVTYFEGKANNSIYLYIYICHSPVISIGRISRTFCENFAFGSFELLMGVFPRLW